MAPFIVDLPINSMVIFQFADCKRLLQITVEIERSIEKIGPAQFLAWEIN